jgi:hypothetical protein
VGAPGAAAIVLIHVRATAARSSDLVGNRTGALPVRSIVSQQAWPLTSFFVSALNHNHDPYLWMQHSLMPYPNVVTMKASLQCSDM